MREYDCDKCVHYRVCYKIRQWHIPQLDVGLYCPSFERKQSEGEWVEDTEYYDDDYSECNVRKVFVCSKCGRTERRKEPYCHCGAQMKGGAE